MHVRKDSVSILNTFLGSHRFEATTNEGRALIQILYFMAQKFADTDSIFLGALAFCQDMVKAKNLKIRSKAFYIWAVSLDYLIETKLQLVHKTSLNPFKKMAYLSAFLGFARANIGEEAIPLGIFKSLEVCTRSLCMQLGPWIAILKKQKPIIPVLQKNFSSLLAECQTNQEIARDRQKFHDLMKLAEEQALILDNAGDYGYKVRFGTILYILSQLDKIKMPLFFQACLDAIHIDDLQDISSKEKLTYLAMFFAIIPKVDPDTYFYSRELEIQKQSLHQMTTLSYSKFALDALHELGALLGKNIVSEKLNHDVKNSLKRMHNFIHATSGHWANATRYSATITNSLFDRLGVQSSPHPKIELYQEAGFINALLALPDDMLSNSVKIRIRDGNLIQIPAEENSVSLSSVPCLSSAR